MNTNLPVQTSETLSEVKFKDLAAIYNTFASELELKTIKKFKDKATGIQRIIMIQGDYADVVEKFLAEHKAKAKKVVKKVEAKKAEEVKLFTVGSVVPKSTTSAMGIIYQYTLEMGEVNLEDLCNHFIGEYSLQYKGKHEVNMSFAKGYIKGAVRAANIKAV